MKKLLLTPIILFLTISGFTQIITLVDEDFTANTMPAGWNQHEFGTGTQAWTFGSAVMPGNATYYVANFPNNAAIFDDDAAGTGLFNYRNLETPFMDADNAGLYAGADVLVRYHYAINNKGSNGENHFEDRLGVYIEDTAGDTSGWLAEHTNSNDPQYNTINLKQVFVDYPNVNPTNFKVNWNFNDVDGSWGWGAGIDDIYVSIQPLNDACQNAIVIPSLPYTNYQNAIGSTNNDGFITPSGCGTGMNDGVWYTFTPSQSGQINIMTSMNISPEWDHAIGVYSGSCGNFTCEAWVDNAIQGDWEAINNLNVVAGTQYFINIGYWSGSTNGTEHKFSLEIDGNLSTSDIATIAGFEMYPNPVKDILNLSADTTIEIVNIYNMLGQEVLKTSPEETQVEINTSSLEPGAYIVKVQAGNQIGSYQLLKE